MFLKLHTKFLYKFLSILSRLWEVFDNDSSFKMVSGHIINHERFSCEKINFKK